MAKLSEILPQLTKKEKDLLLRNFTSYNFGERRANSIEQYNKFINQDKKSLIEFLDKSVSFYIRISYLKVAREFFKSKHH